MYDSCLRYFCDYKCLVDIKNTSYKMKGIYVFKYVLYRLTIRFIFQYSVSLIFVLPVEFDLSDCCVQCCVFVGLAIENRYGY